MTKTDIWSADEIALLRKLYPTHGRARLVPILDRGFDAIKRKATRLGLRVNTSARKAHHSQAAKNRQHRALAATPLDPLPSCWENTEKRERIFAGVDFGSERPSRAHYKAAPYRRETYVPSQSGIA